MENEYEMPAPPGSPLYEIGGTYTLNDLERLKAEATSQGIVDISMAAITILESFETEWPERATSP